MQRPVVREENGQRVVRSHGILPIVANQIALSRGGRQIFESVDFTLAATAETTVLLGPNGAGKSLFIRILAGLVDADRGHVTWSGTPPDRRRVQRIGFVFQRPVLLQRSAFANIDYALAVTGTPAPERTARAHQALEKAGLDHLANQPARELSGGEQQRLTLARALACDPELLILDEPAANLDPASTAAIEQVLKDIRSNGTPVLLITHDLGQARRLADQVVFMHLGKILEQTPDAEFFNAPRSREAAAFVRGEIVI